MLKYVELPDCFYPRPPMTIPPSTPTPKHYLSLSNLDNQEFIRLSVNYLFLFKKSVSFDILKSSLSRVLVDYYPLAGRLRTSIENDHKLEVDCNGEGAVFAEAFMDVTAEELLESSNMHSKSWRKLLCEVEAKSFLDVPPLVIQATTLRCGGMILCTAINHNLCDGIGTSQFIHAWAQLTKQPNTELTIIPFHGRHMLKSRDPPQVKFPHPGYTKTKPSHQVDVYKWILSQPLVVASFTFGHTEVLGLKKQCEPSMKCITTFEVVAAHTWRSWVQSLNLLPTLNVKLLFAVNVRKKMKLPEGYYGNGVVLACAESTVEALLAANNLRHGLKLVQEAKAILDDDEYIRSTIDLVEDKRIGPDFSTSLVMSEWSRLGLPDVDFGEGKPSHMGPLTSYVYCLILPVFGDANAMRVLVSLPESIIESFKHHIMKTEIW